MHRNRQMKIQIMVEYNYVKAIYREISWNLPTLCALLFMFLSVSVLADSMSINLDLDTETCSQYDDTCQHKPEEETIQELYAAAKEVLSRIGLLTNQLKILTTREFYSEPRPLTCEGCNRMEFKSLIAPKALCSGDSQIYLLVQITTIPKETKARMAVRQTWAGLTKGNTASVRYMFLFGTGYSKEDQDIVYGEDKVYNDVLQHDYKDSYYNLTYKVIMGFTWAAKHCPRATFLLRTATDNFINLPALTKYLIKNQKDIQQVQLGKVHPTSSPLRKRDNKFYVPGLEYPYDKYPPFAIGSAFVYSMKAVEEILKIAPNIPFFALEDCWFGMLMQHINMSTVNNDKFDIILDKEKLERIPSGGCPRDGNFFAIHIPRTYWIRNQPAEPHQILYWLWESCAVCISNISNNGID